MNWSEQQYANIDLFLQSSPELSSGDFKAELAQCEKSRAISKPSETT